MWQSLTLRLGLAEKGEIPILARYIKPSIFSMICFVMDLDRSGIRSIEDFQRAASNSEKVRLDFKVNLCILEASSQQWLGRILVGEVADMWLISVFRNWIPQVFDERDVGRMFQPEVLECRGARWVQLNLINAYQKSEHKGTYRSTNFLSR